MSFTRRTFLIGAGAGLTVLAVAACTDVTPTPTGSPTPRPQLVPAPSRVWRSNWAADPFALGAISYLPVGAAPESRLALRTAQLDRVFFAGEATSDQPGTVGGATTSGLRVAIEVANVVGDGERVAIIGAGAAGAEAARLLSGSGVEVIVVEARDRVGGRIDSRTTDDGSSFELGAWTLATDGDSTVIAALDDLGVSSIPLEGSLLVAAEDPAASVPLDALAAAQQEIATRLSAWGAEQLRDAPVSEALEQSGAANASIGDVPAEAIGALFAEATRLATGAESDETSVWFSRASVGLPSVLPEGPLSALVTAGLADARLALSTTVVGIAYDDDGVSLRLGTGESLGVDRVIVTVPLGVLKAGAIEFDPPLPLSMRAAINAVGVGQLELVRVAFDEAFWQTDAVIWSLVGTDAEVTTWVNLQPLTGETVLLGIAAGDAVAALAKLSDDALARALREMLEPFAA